MNIATMVSITGDMVRSYDEDGYVVVRGLFEPDEMAAARAEADRLFARRDLIDSRNIRCRWQPNVVTGDCEFAEPSSVGRGPVRGGNQGRPTARRRSLGKRGMIWVKSRTGPCRRIPAFRRDRDGFSLVARPHGP